GAVDPNGAPLRAGVGDLALSYRHVLLAAPREASLVSAGVELGLATGNRRHGLGAGTTVVAPQLLSGHALGPLVVQTQVRAELPADPARADRRMLYRVALQLPLGPYKKSPVPALELEQSHALDASVHAATLLAPTLYLPLSRRGHVPIYEPGLEELIRRNVSEARLAFSIDLDDAVKKSAVCFIAVGTPEGADGAADLSAVMDVAAAIGRTMDGYRVIVAKSTVPIGTAERIKQAVAAATRHPFDVVSNPEFLKEGAAIEDFMKPDRVVIGATSQRAIDIMRELYEPFVRTGNPILVMDNASAEMTKYAANALLATRISFMNEIANLCERVGADVDQVRRGIGYDRRIGHHFLFPGVGYGGSCFPKDVKAVIRTAREQGLAFPVLAAVEAVNEEQKRRLVDKVIAHFGSTLRGRRFAVW